MATLYDWAICSYDEFVESLTDSTVPESEKSLINRIINAVTDFIEGPSGCNRRIKRRSELITEYPYTYNTNFVFLNHPPVSVQDVWYSVDGEFDDSTKLDITSYVVNSETGMIIWKNGSIFKAGYNFVKVTYYGGYVNVPEDLKDVAIQLAIYIYKRYKTKAVLSDSISTSGGMSIPIKVVPDSYQQRVIDSYKLIR